MKPSGRLLHRRQGVQRSERDLVSVLIAEGSLSSDWLVKCGHDDDCIVPIDDGGCIHVNCWLAHGSNGMRLAS